VIPFSKPAAFMAEAEYLTQVRESHMPWGGGAFYKKASDKLAAIHRANDVLLTQSCTAALELAALGLNLGPEDEVIVPSYTFVTTASAFAMRGARVVFVDSEPETLNIDVSKIEALVTSRTKAIVVVHYGGVPCDMDEIMAIAKRHGIAVIEDAAQAIGSSYKGQPLGTIGDIGCLSFHGTKNVSSGEGGALLINSTDSDVIDRLHTAHEKGTDRAKFLRGEVDRYTWRKLGSSFIPSEFTCAVLLAQLENLEEIQFRRRTSWGSYAKLGEQEQFRGFRWLNQDIEGSNLHMFAVIAPDSESREWLRKDLKAKGIVATSHYEPLHSSPFALSQDWPRPHAPIAQALSERILRLPLWSEINLPVEQVTSAVISALESKRGVK
jgi:dTDP-4-amino-4,6-dideoxygalactose transaminase